MNKEIAMKWADELESGKYLQGKYKLRTTLSNGKTAFCCLGVLCNMHAEAHPDIAAKQTNPNKYLDETVFLPMKVMEWASLKYHNGYYTQYDNSLSSMNDHGNNFKYIVNFIRYYWQSL